MLVGGGVSSQPRWCRDGLARADHGRVAAEPSSPRRVHRPGPCAPLLRGRQDVIAMAARVRATSPMMRVQFFDPEIRLSGDSSGTTRVTVQVTTREAGGDEVAAAHVVSIALGRARRPLADRQRARASGRIPRCEHIQSWTVVGRPPVSWPAAGHRYRSGAGPRRRRDHRSRARPVACRRSNWGCSRMVSGGRTSATSF